MTNKWIAFCIVGCLGLLCLLVNMTLGPRSEANGSANLKHAERSAQKASAIRPTLFVSVSDVFGRLERPPVAFDHDKHTAALEPGGCGQCHHEDKDAKGFLFTYPKDRDETNGTALMDSFHEDCIGCHEQRIKKKLDAGPVTCGECHVIRREHASPSYGPILPQYYETLRDTYHKDCLACHRESAEKAPKTVPLDWKNFYMARNKQAEADWPKVAFDHFMHEEHRELLQGTCEPCHSISPARQKQLEAEGRKPTGQDWLWDANHSDGLTDRAAAHAQCINCHLQPTTDSDERGPVRCEKCHDGAVRTVEDMVNVPRLACGQDERILIQFGEHTRAKAVAFNHKSHEANTRSCQDCHHTTLRPCKDCHTVDGSEHGGGVTLAEAYHQVSSTRSCVGCHEAEKKKPSCAGCHHAIPGGLVQSACSGCHTGSLESLDRVTKLPDPEELLPRGVKEKLHIRVIEKEYESAEMPHLMIAQSLTDLSNRSTLATHFHTNEMTICAGCHHLGPLEAKTDIPPCVTCHTTRDQSDGGTPTLLGAYHLVCLGCHQQMDPSAQELSQDCTGCHEEKEKATPGGKTLAAHTQD